MESNHRTAKRAILTYAGLFCAVALVYGQALFFPFVNFDDGLYVTGNAHVRAGLSLENLWWAFSAPRIGLYHPLAWLSLMADSSLYGVRAWGFHLSGIVLHALVCCGLYAALARMTKAPGRGAAVALLFAVHPLNVEPVVWISSRKDVLSGLFFVLLLLAYQRYTERPGLRRYVLVAAPLALGLLSKAMLVAAPLLLLLIDYWPLRRLGDRRAMLRAAAEKLPLLALSGLTSLMAIHASRLYGSLGESEDYPLPSRLANVVANYASQFQRALWPRDLAPQYPIPEEGLALVHTAVAGAVLLAITLLALAAIRKAPYLTVGWGWFLVMLLPVVGLLQIGGHATADRYAYLPLTGLLIALVWGGAALAGRFRWRRGTLLGLTALVAVPLTALSAAQTHQWRSSEALWQHTLSVTHNNNKAHYNLGNIYLRQGRNREAAEQYEKAIAVNQHDCDARVNLGMAYVKLGATDIALEALRQATIMAPENGRAHYEFAKALLAAARPAEAMAHLEKTLEIETGHVDAQVELVRACLGLGELARARRAAEALALSGIGRPDALANAGTALCGHGETALGLKLLRRAAEEDPLSADIRYNLGNALLQQGQYHEAIETLAVAVEHYPEDPDFHCALGFAFRGAGKTAAARQHLEKALRLAPGMAAARQALAEMDSAVN